MTRMKLRVPVAALLAACANRFVQDWARAHGATLKDPCGAPEWHRRDETVARIIAERGKLGTGE